MADVIRNTSALATTSLRKDALAIAEAGYAAVDVGRAIAKKVCVENDALVVDGKRFALGGRRVFFVGVGKCAVAGAEAIERVLGEHLTNGIALDVRHAPHRLAKIQVFTGTHPKPSEANTDAARRIVELLTACTEQDLVIMLISGGGSTLLCLPEPPMTCADEGMLFDALTAGGTSIQEMNTVRKHISKARGGGLAAAAHPAEVVSLIISDVPGNDIQYVCSGPTVQDSSSIADAQAVLDKYAVAAPSSGFFETPKDASLFARVSNLLFLTNRDALEAMEQAARARGYSASIVDDALSGEARDVAANVIARLHSAAPRTALLYGGETTVTLTTEHAEGSSTPLGTGGRNQELALAALESLRQNELILPFASDGRDATDFAGAIADSETLAHAGEHHLAVNNFLARHASFDLFSQTGDGLDTGLLESNVSDLLIALTK